MGHSVGPTLEQLLQVPFLLYFVCLGKSIKSLTLRLNSEDHWDHFLQALSADYETVTHEKGVN